MYPDEEFVYDATADREFDALFAILRGNPDINVGHAAKQAQAAVKALKDLQVKRNG